MISMLLYGILMTETGGKPNPADGDGGRSIGPYQIGRMYHDDAEVYLARLGFDGTTKGGFGYGRCREKAYSELIVIGYAMRYSPEEIVIVKACKGKPTPAVWKAAEVIARRHNGGLRGDRKKATVKYWGKVKKHMETYIAEHRTKGETNAK